jgi:hypothetical protein
MEHVKRNVDLFNLVGSGTDWNDCIL